ncbi:hypothetical protein SAMN06295912_11286 [Sphingomonas laterariae]|uniref:Uncharacterized protein n=1 Tax=Edaphosphingomonas laterariae TaxID=861865 RepID=A0A239GJ52_9SPHN|nr:hypothetical protein [Sphingomonas laterariae]SNS68808.1 hypothetical protein SAMN06295912_11286 [Sphingomonas laterariae]
MKSYQLRIAQVFRVEREMVVAVEAADLQAAIDLQSESDAPAFDDPSWRSTWSLESEEVSSAQRPSRSL